MELGGPLHELPLEALGLLCQFRDYAFIHFGLPCEERDLERVAKQFRMTRLKFRRHWPSLRKLWTECDGRLVYQADEVYITDREPRQ
jgi:hypothetical protein